MPGKNIFIALSLMGSLAGCSDKDNPVIEKKFTTMELNAYTVDPYRFRVSLYDAVVTDSLVTPEAKLTKTVLFDDYHQRIRVYNTSDETLLIDTPYTVTIGKTNVFTIYQTATSTPPFYLAPPPGEPVAAPGNTKLSIIYSGADLPDSAKVVVELQNGSSGTPLDSFMLKKDMFSKYFEIPANRNSSVKMYETPNRVLRGQRQFVPTMLNPDFAIYRLKIASGTSLIGDKLY